MFPPSTKILIVDDMAMFRAMIKQSLTSLELKNYKEATNGEEAWREIESAQANNTPYQLIISDWTMPKMKGIELLKKVRAEAWGRNFPFILLTGEAEKEFIIEAMQNNVTGYMVKPFTPAALKQNLENAYKKSKSTDDGIKVVA